jgi:hypothetical protein
MSKGSFISPEQRSGIRARIEPIALAMARVGLTPNMLTLIGFGIAALGALLAAVEWWLLAGIVATAGAAFDMFDGAVARATGTVSKLGAFMDSTFDRWGEGVVYLGIVIGCTQAGFDRPRGLARGGRPRLRLHGQLRPGQERVARLLERHRHGRHRSRAA